MDEAARLRVIIQAQGVREAQRGIESVDSSLTGAAISAHKLEKAQASLRLQSVQVEKAQTALARATKKHGAESIQAREAAARLGVAQQRVADTNRAVASASRGASQRIAATTKEVDRGTKSLSRLKTQAQRSAAALSRMGRAGAIGGTAAIAVGFGAAVKAGFKFNAQMESNELAMRRFIGSTAQTQKYLKDLADLAESSPFEFTQLTQGARRMMAFGLSATQTKKTLTAVADAIAAAGGGAERIDQVTLALGQMATKGRVSGEELLQLNEAGIPATKILKRELGLTGEQVGKIGNLGIKSGVAIRALTQGMTRDFKGASQEQSRTWEGMTSTLRDKWARTTGSMTRGLFREAKKWAPRIGETLDEIGRVFRGKDLSLGDKISLSAAKVRRNIIDPIVDAVGRMHLGGKLAKAVEDAAPRVADAMAAAAPKAAGAFVNAFKEAGPWGKLLTVAFLASKMGAFSAVGSLAAERFWRRYRRRSLPLATAAGTAGGAANAAAFTAASSAGMIGGRGKFRSAALAIGRYMGPIMAIPIALELSNYLTEKFGHTGGVQGQINKTAAGVRDIIDDARNPAPAIRAPRGGVPRDPDFRPSAATRRSGGARRGGRSGQSLADLRLKTRGAANQRIRDRVDTIDFQLEMGRITAGAAADQLEALAMGVKHNKRLRRQILVSAHNLRQQAAQDARQAAEDAKQERRRAAAHEASERRRAVTERRGARAAHQREVRAAKARERKRGGGMSGSDFQLNVGDVRIPTVYEVRRTRLEKRGRAGHAPVGVAQHSQPTTTIQGGVHIVINGSKSPKETAQEVAAVLDRTRQTHGRAVKRARAKKKGHR